MNMDRIFSSKLTDAIVKGDVNVAKRLIKGGVDVNKLFWYDGNLLHEAVITGNIEVVTLLIQAGIDVDKANKSGDTALHLACRRKNLRVVKYLLEQKAVVNIPTQAGKTPLHIAIWQESEDIAQLLLQHGASVVIVDQDDWSALHWATRSKSLHTIITNLLDHGATINAKTKVGATPLHLSVVYKNPEAAKILIENGADTSMPPPKSAVHSFSCSRLRNSNPDGRTLLNILHKCGLILFHDKNCQKDTPSFVNCRCLKIDQPTKDEPKTASEPKTVWKSFLRCQHCGNGTVKTFEGILSLGHYSRNTIRKHLNIVHGGRAIKKYTQTLPLPQILKEYLIFTEELQSV